VRDLTIEEIWRRSERMGFGRLRSVDELWGYCRSCYYADVCRAGCTWTSESLLGRRGNNPYCHYRVRDLARQGRRERVVKVKDAPPESFAIGEFALVEEAIPGAAAAEPPRAAAPVHLHDWIRTPEGGALPPKLDLCRACDEYIWPHETTCPHCGSDVEAARIRHEEDTARRRRLIREARRILAERAAARPPG
jgi:hypothetical protein